MSSSEVVTITSPATQTIIATRKLSSLPEAIKTIEAARSAQKAWAARPLSERITAVRGFVDAFLDQRDDVATELANLIGRPIKYCHNEINTFADRANYLLSIAKDALADTVIPSENPIFNRYIRRAPLGTILVIAAWNYPYLIMANGVIPALLAGNAVVLKQAPQTLPTAERLSEAAKTQSIPLHHLHASHDLISTIIPNFNHTHFTGSVLGGIQVSKAVANSGLGGLGLELGGKDPAYVRGDVDDVESVAEALIDGAFYNSGQSCCAVERVYVHVSVYDAFVAAAAKIARSYKLGGPFDEGVTLGPVISPASAIRIRGQIRDAVAKGAVCLVDESLFPLAADSGSAFVAPQVLVGVDHGMEVMREETFGPVVGIMRVESDEEAVALMNDSRYGLTASVWTKDEVAGVALLDRLDAGTVFLNRCDYLDPALPWCGWKDSGRGVTLSKLGFDAVTKTKSFHIKRLIKK